MAEKLKACPCCGEAAEIDKRQTFRSIDGGRLMEALAVYCTGCMLQISVCYADVPGITADQVIAMWNTRAQLPSQGGEAVEVPRVLGLDHPHCPRNPLIADGFRCGADWMRRQVLALGPLYTRPATPADSRVVPVELLERIAYMMETCELDGPTFRDLSSILAKP